MSISRSQNPSWLERQSELLKTSLDNVKKASEAICPKCNAQKKACASLDESKKEAIINSINQARSSVVGYYVTDIQEFDAARKKRADYNVSHKDLGLESKDHQRLIWEISEAVKTNSPQEEFALDCLASLLCLIDEMANLWNKLDGVYFPEIKKEDRTFFDVMLEANGKNLERGSFYDAIHDTNDLAMRSISACCDTITAQLDVFRSSEITDEQKQRLDHFINSNIKRFFPRYEFHPANPGYSGLFNYLGSKLTKSFFDFTG